MYKGITHSASKSTIVQIRVKMSTKEAEQLAHPATPESHSSIPTLTPQPETSNGTAIDEEKQQPGPPTMPGAPFPDGGLKAWAAVTGAWLFGKSGLLF